MQHNSLENIVEKIISDKTGVFDEIYTDYIQDLLYKVSSSLNKLIYMLDKNVDIDMDKILLSIGKAFKKYLIGVCSKSLIGELYNSKEQLNENDSKKNYEYFIKLFLSERYESFFGENTNINKIIENKITLLDQAINEFFSRLLNDITQIEDYFNIKINEISNIHINEGDTHNNGRAVYQVEFNKSYNLIYKPHSLINDELYSDILNYINERGAQKPQLRSARVLCRDDYGWQEYVVAGECKTQKQVEGYMYRLGSILFISYITNCNDLHLENIIASGEYPYVIDTETFFNNRYMFKGYHVKNQNPWDKLILESVYNSFMIPNNIENIKEQKRNIINNLCGIMGGYKEDEKLELVAIVGQGTDEIRFDKILCSSKTLFKPKNNVTLNGEKIDVNDYLSHIIEGFTNCYRIILSSKEEFKKFINNFNFDKGMFRQIFRNTTLYGKYLSASYHPYYIHNNSSRLEVFSKISGKAFNSKEHEMLIEQEIRQLIKGDVPYFYAKSNSLDLYTVDGPTISNFYSKTIAEIFIDKIDNLSEKDYMTQVYFIRCALSRYDINKSILNGYLLPKADTLDDIIKGIASYIEDYHSINSEDNSTKYYYNIVADQEKNFLARLKPVLYFGGGMSLFYLQLYTRYKYEKYKNIAETLLHTYNTMDFQSDFNGKLGVFEGVASMVYVNYQAWRLLGDKKYYEYYKSYIDFIMNQRLEEYQSADIIVGLSGIIIMALNIYKDDSAQLEALELARKCGEQLYEMYNNNSIDKNSGMAHGYSGVASAFMMLSHYLGNQLYYNASMHLIKEEDSLYDENTNNWISLKTNTPLHNTWCYGAPGILVSRMLMVDYASKKDKKVIEEDIKKCVKRVIDFGYVDRFVNVLCHGNAGNLDALLSYYIKYNDKEVYDFIKECMRRMHEEIKSMGLIYNFYLESVDISFMAGISGLGYFLLRLFDNNIPSVLFLDV